VKKRWNLNYMPHEFNDVKEYVDQMKDFPAPWNNALAFAATLYSENKRIESRVRELEAERDRLKKTIASRDRECASEHWGALNDCIADNLELRARHAALVETAGRTVLNNPHTTGELKAALAEVKS
jgi:hypothetical protein